MLNSTTINKVKKELETWRSNKTARSDRIPQVIRAKITNLLLRHPKGKIRKKLKLSAHQIQNFSKKLTKLRAKKEEHKVEFKKIVIDTNAPIIATMEDVKGCRLNLNLRSIEELQVIINTFLIR